MDKVRRRDGVNAITTALLDIPPQKKVLRSDQTQGVSRLWRELEGRLYLAIWKRRKGTYATRILTQQELIDFLRQVRNDGFGQYIRIFRIEYSLIATVLRGKVRMKTHWRWW